MKTKRVLEIGIAVKDVEKATKLFADAIGLTPGPLETYEGFKMRYTLCQLGNLYFEFMESTAKDGPIGKFLEKHGEGLHHIGVEVENLDKAIADFKKKGIQIIDETPVEHTVSYGKVKAVFAHPKALHSTMVELIELL